MWIGKRAAEFIAHLIAEKAVNAELRAQLARERERFAWAAEMMNELRLERAELYRRIGIVVPTPQIERASTPPLPGADDNYVVPDGGKAADIGELMAAARELRDKRTRPALKDLAVPPAAIGADMFEDVGDDGAAAIGAQHDTAGNLVYAR